MVLMHPCFRGTIDDEVWLYMCPTKSGLEDPKLGPTAEDLAGNAWQHLKTSPSFADAAGGMHASRRRRNCSSQGACLILERLHQGLCFHKMPKA